MNRSSCHISTYSSRHAVIPSCHHGSRRSLGFVGIYVRSRQRLDDSRPLQQEVAHVTFEEERVGYAAEDAERRGIRKVVDHQRPALEFSELMPVREVLERPLRLLVHKLMRPLADSNPRREPLPHAEVHGLPGDVLPGSNQAAGHAGYRALFCPSRGSRMHVDIAVEVEANAHRRRDERLEVNDWHGQPYAAARSGGSARQQQGTLRIISAESNSTVPAANKPRSPKKLDSTCSTASGSTLQRSVISLTLSWQSQRSVAEKPTLPPRKKSEASARDANTEPGDSRAMG